jgi:regulatory protein
MPLAGEHADQPPDRLVGLEAADRPEPAPYEHPRGLDLVALVDDKAFAREWVAQRQEGRGLARRALAQELRRKGIDDEVAREALGVVDESDEVEAARMLVRRKLRSVRGLEGDKAVRRLVGMLARKGHSSGVAYRVVREELGADLADPEHL